MYNRWIYDKVNSLVEKYHTRNPEELLDLLGIKLHYIDSPSKLLGVYQVILRNRVILIANNIGSLKKSYWLTRLATINSTGNTALMATLFTRTRCSILPMFLKTKRIFSRLIF